MKSGGIILLIAIILFSELSGQILPSFGLYEWDRAGLTETPFIPDTTINVTSTGIANDGSTDASPALNSILSAYNNSGLCLYFPPGEYLFQSTITVPSNTIIKGSGPDSTFFRFDLSSNSGHCFQVVGIPGSGYVPVQQGLVKGSNFITVNGASVLQPDDYVEIKQENDSWDSNPATWATDVVGQIVKVVSVNGKVVELDQEIRFDYDSLLNPQVRKISPVSMVGFECFSIERIDQAGGTSHNFLFTKAASCWVKGVESRRSNGSHIMIAASTNIEVRNSYIHHAFNYSGTSTYGYGVTLAQHSGLCLIENNIFKYLRHAMMVKEGANGNVFGYNYSREPNRSELISNFSGDISLHGHYPYANLFEGNIVQNIIIDHYWGPSGPHNTFLRNATELYGLLMTSGSPNTNEQYFIANDMQNNSLYFLTGNGHVEAANRFQDSVQASGQLPVSYYKDSTPEFWNLPLNWPYVGVPTNKKKYTNPSKERYFSEVDRAYCNQDKISDLCIAPVNLSSSYKGGKKVQLEWKSAPWNTQYQIRGRKSTEIDWITLYVNCYPCENIVVNSLEPVSEYEWQVRADCGDSVSLWSAMNKFILDELSDCDTVKIYAESVDATSSLISWSGVEDAKFYRLLGRRAGSSEIVEIILSAEDTSYLATGLSPGTTYEYVIVSICDSVGYAISDLTEIQSFTTLNNVSEDLKEDFDIIYYTHYNSIEIPMVSDEEILIEIFNIGGKSLLQKKLSDTGKIILPELSPGIYFLRANSEYRTIFIY